MGTLTAFRVEVTDEVCYNYTQEEFNAIRDQIFGLAVAAIDGEWAMWHDHINCVTVYMGNLPEEMVQLFIAFAKGEGIKFMEIMGWR